MVSTAIQVFVAPNTHEKLAEIEPFVGSLSTAARLSMMIGSRRSRERSFHQAMKQPRTKSVGDDVQRRIIVNVPPGLGKLIDELSKTAGSTSAAARALLKVGTDDVYQLLIANYKGESR